MAAVGGATGRAPLCFAKEALAAPAFAPDAFIAECRRRVPLEALLADLRAFAATLEHELVELINEDYADFVSLSSNLTGIDRHVADLRTALLSLRKDLTAVRAAVHGAISEVENKLDEKRHAARKQAALQLMVNTSKTLAKIERLLHLQGAGGAEGGGAVEAVVLRADEESSNLIERVASDFNQLRFYVAKGRGLPFVERVTARIQAIEGVLGEGLVSIFRHALAQRDTDQTLNCLRTYAAIERAADAEAVFRAHVVRPGLAAIITEARLEGGARGSCDGLSSVYSEVLAFVDAQCAFLLDAAHRTSNSPFLFVAHAVWPEAVELLTSRVARIFAPGLPDLFHRNYTASALFLDLLERASRSRRELLALRATPAYADFTRRWQVHVYFKLRFQEIVRRVEGALAAPPAARPAELRASGWALAETEEVAEALRRCWAPGVFLPVLSADFLRLSLQLVARFASWLEAGSAQAWAALPPDALPLLCLDVRRLADLLPADLAADADAAATTAGNDGRAAIRDAYRDAGAALRLVAARVATAATAPVVRRAVEALGAARMIPSAYRWTGKAAPTRPSPYVALAVAALRDFFAAAPLARLLEPAVRLEWAADAASRITDQCAPPPFPVCFRISL